MQVVQENGVPRWLRQKRICLQCRRHRFDPWVGKCPWRRKRQPTPLFLLGESLGQRSLMGYNPWGPKESAMTEQLKFSLFTGKQWGKKGHVTSVMTWYTGIYSVCRRVHTDASMCVCMLSRVWLFPTPWTTAIRLLCPWDLPGKSTGGRCRFLLHGVFPTEEQNQSAAAPSLQAYSSPLNQFLNCDTGTCLFPVTYQCFIFESVCE